MLFISRWEFYRVGCSGGGGVSHDSINSSDSHSRSEEIQIQEVMTQPIYDYNM